MKLQIERPQLESHGGALSRPQPLEGSTALRRPGGGGFTQLSGDEIDFLQDLYRDGGTELATRSAQIATLQRAFNDKSVRFTSDALEASPCSRPSLPIWWRGAIQGWLFTASVTSRTLPYVVTRIDYTAPSNDEAGRLFVERKGRAAKANAKGALTSTTLRISAATSRQDGGGNLGGQGVRQGNAGAGRRL